MTVVSAYSYTHSVTFVADNILRSFKEIIREAGLSPAQFVADWEKNQRAIRSWMESGHLRRVVLEIFHPVTDELIHRWDLDIAYEWSGGDGSFYADMEQLKYAMKKAGVAPSHAKYDIVLQVTPGHPSVSGWGDGACRSTAGLTRHALGSTIDHNGLGASAAYWRRA
ncbi:HORMA domain containing protein [Sphingopyxis bauzanensis]|uniref:HORMA domain containing protein n=1 Tax=Sphingopyxis bauzanensis TaxID=651663 RepID=A0A246K0D3_9SPHN|nr:HORMA domain containing protein [Sphingopyxis bauzanensis]OWQ98966.1 HORMA domain containing protein [Sphingopyxis bauzanensis]GGJ64829.1 hypothetical protein GCM10011393_38920 [Sphingopyxis bauzanensis]